jgi:capsular exopolysaccharide synthesis family protein
MTRVYEALLRKAAEEEKGDVTSSGVPATAARPACGADIAHFQSDVASLAHEAIPDPVTTSTTFAGARTPPLPEPTSRTDASISGSATAVSTARLPVGDTNGFEPIEVAYRGRTILDPDVSAQSCEQYRRLAANLHQAQGTLGIKVVMVTSAVVGEGKTLTSANLALTLSESYQKRVLLIDADFRRPSLHVLFSIEPHGGFSAGLTSDAQPVRAAQLSTFLSVLPGGQPTSDPIAALTSDRMRQLIAEARDTFDWVILDTPPIALLSDASLVASITDGALIVVKAGSTSSDLVERAVQAVGRERVLGIVLNRATEQVQSSEYYEYYRYYATAER